MTCIVLHYLTRGQKVIPLLLLFLLTHHLLVRYPMILPPVTLAILTLSIAYFLALLTALGVVIWQWVIFFCKQQFA